MIGRLRGIIIEKELPQVILEAYGVGYEIFMPISCFYSLPETGQEAIIFTHFLVRHDTQLLFGFINKSERFLFSELIKVNGIGPKLALAILSSMSVEQFINNIECQQINALVKLPGVGKKIAERLMLEMKDKFNDYYRTIFSQNSERNISSTIKTSKLSSNSEDEAVAALVALGYKPQEASKMVSKVVSEYADCEMLIRNALRITL